LLHQTILLFKKKYFITLLYFLEFASLKKQEDDLIITSLLPHSQWPWPSYTKQLVCSSSNWTHWTKTALAKNIRHLCILFLSEIIFYWLPALYV